jgi:phosphopantetheinyl transferase (holo-ACP synthase)
LKEAAYKSISFLEFDSKITWKSFEVKYERGAPKIRLKDGMRLKEGGTVDLMGSLSHDAGCVVGVCVAIRKV